jgi:streptogramin lyase
MRLRGCNDDEEEARPMMIRRGSWFLALWMGLLVGLARPAAAQTSTPVYNPDNGHWYQAVPVPGGIAWPAARATAAAMSYAGYPGHLATLTSEGETRFVVNHLPLYLDDHWRVGGLQDRTAPDYREPAGGWRWITGEPWSTTNWRGGEPNNVGGEDFLEIHADGSWNDTADQPPGGGFIVEYEPLPIGFNATLLQLFPNPVVGGQGATGQVTLSQPAGFAGVPIFLISSNPSLAAIPPVVTVPPGAATAYFTVATFPVTAPTPVAIIATSLAGTASATLQLLPGGSPPGNLLVNGSFEEPRMNPGQAVLTLGPGGLPGWQVTRGTIDLVQSWEPAPGQGRQSLDLVGSPGAATIEQSFATEPGREYLFSGWVSHNSGIREGRADVSLNGIFLTELFHNIPGSDGAMHWAPFAFPFRATGWLTTLAISDVSGLDTFRGTALDGLAVTPLPGPFPPLPPTAGGVLLVSSHDNSSVLRYDARTGGLIDAFVPSGSGGLALPHGLAMGPDGSLYISSRGGHSILRYDARTGAVLGTFVPPGSGGLDTPIGLAFDPDGNLLVASYGSNRVLRYDGRNGAYLGVVVPPGRGGMDGPYDLRLGPDGWLYVASRNNSSILRVEPQTGVLRDVFVSPGAGGLDGPNALAFGPDGNLYVSSWKTNSVLRYDGRNGAILGAFVPPGNGGLTEPWGLTFGPDGNLYVPSAGTDSVLRYDGRTGAFLGAFVAGSGLRRPDWLLFVPGASPGPPLPAATAPASPSELTAERVFATRVDLRWRDNSDNELLFILWRRTGNGDYVRIGEVNANVTTFSDTGLQPQTTYTYVVRAWNRVDASHRSNELTVQTLASEAPTAPNPPTGLTATAISATEIRLTWQDNSQDEAVFVVYRKEAGSDYVKIADVPTNQTSYVDRGLRPGTSYSYVIRAWNPSGGASHGSTPATATTPFAQ